MELNNFKTNAPLASYTSLNVGGPADYLYEARTDADLKEAIYCARKADLPCIVIGGGTNLFVSDKGFRGAVVIARNNIFSPENETIVCGAGTPVGALVAYATRNGLAGLEWAAGLPGTIGGAVVGNAGTFGKSVEEVVTNVRTLIEGEERIFAREECGFGYRTSIFKTMPNATIISVTIALRPGSALAVEETVKQNMLWRSQHHPPYRSAGCIFKNCEPSPSMNLPREQKDGLPQQWFEKVPAGWLVDKAGLKGKTAGGFVISTVHGNFFVNQGNGTAGDLHALIQKAKKDVRDKFCVDLEEEICRIGSF